MFEKRRPQPKRPVFRPVVCVVLIMLTSLTISIDRAGAQETQSLQAPTRETSAFRPCRFSNLDRVEPEAGTWKTWVLESPRQINIGAPPYAPDEVAELRQLELQRTAAVIEQVKYWNAGGPSYRWNEIALAQIAKAASNNVRASRVMALVNVAIYDAIIAAWDNKYLHQRPRPSECTGALTTVIDTPQSPSYPSSYAAAAGAASAVLAYLYPAEAKALNDQADKAALSRLHAGVNYRSDVTRGLELGRAVAALVIEWAKNDGSSAVYSGTPPTGECNWRGTNPVEPLAGTWKTWVLTSGSELRPPAPPACGSPQFNKEIAEVKDFPRPTPTTAASFPTTRAAYFWQGNAIKIWHDILAVRLFEYNLDANPPRSARLFSLLHIAAYDSTIACFDAKYTYWYIRPSQFDSSIRTLFAVPNHPAYPSFHAIYDGSYAEILSYHFPLDEAFFRAQALEAATSRIWAGIHYRSDVDAGLALSREVGKKVIELAKKDGSE